MSVPYIGSKISLISNAGIRYEGVLYNIDMEKATVALSNVRSFGTEDRPAANPVPPSDDTYAFIIFRGSDIKDLRVCEASAPAPLSDPAILSQTRDAPPAPAPAAAAPAAAAPAPAAAAAPAVERAPRGPGAAGNARRTASQEHQPRPKVEGEFDFASSNAKFNKDDLKDEFLQKLAAASISDGSAAPAAQAKPSYDKKSSFFDNLSADAEKGAQRYDRAAETRTDAETFGSDEVSRHQKQFRRGGRGGRGGQRGAGGRGGNRGGHYSSNSGNSTNPQNFPAHSHPSSAGGNRGGNRGGRGGNRGGASTDGSWREGASAPRAPVGI